MDYYEEEESQIKNVISHKKNEFRVEIRRKKVQQELQSKRLKNIHQSYSKLFENNGYQAQDDENQEQYSQNNQLYQDQVNNHGMEDMTQKDNRANEIPNILEISGELNKVMQQLQDSHKMKDIIQCQDIMKQLYEWIDHYCKKEVMVEVTSVLNLMIQSNLHIFCSVYTSQKYLQYEDLQIYSYYILAQLSCIINKQNLNEMVEKNIFNHFIEALQYSKSSKIIDNLFHTMGNLAGDSKFGSFFCSELVDRDIVTAVLSVIEESTEQDIERFNDSLLFFIWNFIRYIPEVQREETYQLTPLLLLLLRITDTDSKKKYVIECLNHLILYDSSNISVCTEDDYNTLAWLIYNNKSLIGSSLTLLNTIVSECCDEYIKKLVDNGVLISIIKVIESGKESHRQTAAFILSNISCIPDQGVQDSILEEKIYKPLMRSLMDDSSFKVKKELGFFLGNLVSSATAETIITLIDKKSLLNFIEMLFTKFNSDIDLMVVVIQGFCSLFKQITLFTSNQQFRKYMKQIQEIGLFTLIEQFTNHQNQEISQKAEGLYNELLEHSLISEKKCLENSPTRAKNMPISFYNARNTISELQNQTNGDIFKLYIQNNCLQNQQSNIISSSQQQQISNNYFDTNHAQQQQIYNKNQMIQE
ncbi:importin subunit alpha, putative (macronuclear) [Tetrahymena thermophila SB210]|uniref:Importin subunit alpha, putative n=1 Tax=Tetrahymena thermophila (strain SB210) TaxID=312017 RepID=I7MJX7_TETTS|nr:importin subunit alpha, putative [Tetrahymena thermophila SB210]EAR97293.1 importin subunit alpha, putative [Tetrahymena thermophila SB210]|eukprot:XP_001017538.1 importin subunit alpha, putative [Tetrahymena thermophila SB210]